MNKEVLKPSNLSELMKKLTSKLTLKECVVLTIISMKIIPLVSLLPTKEVAESKLD
jgi:hypothetical protein